MELQVNPHAVLEPAIQTSSNISIHFDSSGSIVVTLYASGLRFLTVEYCTYTAIPLLAWLGTHALDGPRDPK